MAIPATATGARHQRSEEADALYGVVVAITAASGGMLACFAALNADLPIIALPTAALLLGMVRRSLPLSAWSGVAVWALVLPLAPGVAVLAPVLMGLACLAFAIGPDRLLDWVRDEWIGRMADEPVDVGWIEDER